MDVAHQRYIRDNHFAVLPKLTALLAKPQVSPVPQNPSLSTRVRYAVESFAAAAHLLGSCSNGQQADKIIERLTEMLNMVWTVQYRSTQGHPPAIKDYWDAIHTTLVTTSRVSAFIAFYGEEVNPPLARTRGHVHVQFVPPKAVAWFLVKLQLTDESDPNPSTST